MRGVKHGIKLTFNDQKLKQEDMSIILNDYLRSVKKMTSKVWDKQHGGSHYQKFKIQPSKFVVENELLFPEGCAIKYICRHRLKGKKEDILKAIHFLEMILERDYKEIEKPKKETKQTSNSWGIIK